MDAAARRSGHAPRTSTYRLEDVTDKAGVANQGAKQLFRNSGAPGRHWIGIRLVGTKSVRDGTGASLKLTAGPLVSHDQAKGGLSYCSSQDPRILFGLAARKGGLTRDPLAERRAPGASRPPGRPLRHGRGRQGAHVASVSFADRQPLITNGTFLRGRRGGAHGRENLRKPCALPETPRLRRPSLGGT